MSRLRSTRDPGLRAVVVARRALRFDGDPVWPHVRAASAIVRAGDRLVVVQDDALVVAELGGAGVEALPLPLDDAGRRLFAGETKRFKPDLEAAIALPDGRLVLFGSGSTDERERVYVISGTDVRVVRLADLYRSLRAALGPDVALNVEGAMVCGPGLTLLQRGNGAGAVDAELRLSLGRLVARLDGDDRPPPRIAVRRWDLGALGDARLTFTDGLPVDRRRFLYTASAEASPNTVDDGVVTGSAIGWAGVRGGRWAPIVAPDGTIPPLKAEGLARGDRPGEWLVTTDADDVDTPSDLLTVRLEGAWP